MEQEDKDRIFDILAANDIAKVVMAFSGGHDEGYADGWEFYSTDLTKEVEFNPPAAVLADYKNIQADMEEVMLEYFDYFAGRESAWGNVEWDVAKRKVVLIGEQDVCATETIAEEL